jgi:hypothetical protein
MHQAIKQHFIFFLRGIKQHFIKRIIRNRLLVLTPLVHACSWHHNKPHTSRSRGRWTVCLVLDSVQHDRASSLNVYVYVYVEGHVEIQKYMLADIVHVSLSICLCYPDFALPTTSLALTVITTIGKKGCMKVTCGLLMQIS